MARSRSNHVPGPGTTRRGSVGIAGSKTTAATARPRVLLDGVAAATAAGLIYVSDATPGIRRTRVEGGFSYTNPDGSPLRDPSELARIAALDIPPAWTEVWICPLPNGHLQATGHDARGRKQYRYHAAWRALRDDTKYHRMIPFGEMLPALRAQGQQNLARDGLPRERVLAAIVVLLDSAHIRIGNQIYTRENETFGLTTLRHEHVRISDDTITFHFRGKAGKEHTIDVHDRRLAEVLAQCLSLPGPVLFQHLDAHGHVHPIESHNVNAYLHAVSGHDFTAKDFRTWAGTVTALRALSEQGPSTSSSQARRNVAQAIKAAADQLGNTPAICRKSYVFPGVIAEYLDGSLWPLLTSAAGDAIQWPPELRPGEREVILLLRHHAQQETRARASA